jgi:hypothetical protein
MVCGKPTIDIGTFATLARRIPQAPTMTVLLHSAVPFIVICHLSFVIIVDCNCVLHNRQRCCGSTQSTVAALRKDLRSQPCSGTS